LYFSRYTYTTSGTRLYRTQRSGHYAHFISSALKDSGAFGREGNDLQRIQIIDVLVDDAGNTHE
jgi:hypothetical protein